MDRRGRGASSEGPSYDIAREYEDVAALIDAIADISGSKVDVYGHSMGSFIAFGAAPLTSNIRRLALYEGWPRTNPQGVPYSHELVERLNALLERGENEALLETYFRESDQIPDEEISELKSMPSWPGRVAAAHTLLREDWAYFNTVFDPEHAARITVPTLLLTGGDSPELLKADIDMLAETPTGQAQLWSISSACGAVSVNGSTVAPAIVHFVGVAVASPTANSQPTDIHNAALWAVTDRSDVQQALAASGIAAQVVSGTRYTSTAGIVVGIGELEVPGRYRIASSSTPAMTHPHAHDAYWWTAAGRVVVHHAFSTENLSDCGIQANGRFAHLLGGTSRATPCFVQSGVTGSAEI